MWVQEPSRAAQNLAPAQIAGGFLPATGGYDDMEKIKSRLSCRG